MLSGGGRGFVSVRGAAIPQAPGYAATPYADWARDPIVELRFQAAGTERGRQAESALIPVRIVSARIHHDADRLSHTIV